MARSASHLPMLRRAGGCRDLELDDFSSSHHPAPSFCFARDLFRKPVPARIKSGAGFFGITR
jgi:hypothetical protein